MSDPPLGWIILALEGLRAIAIRYLNKGPEKRAAVLLSFCLLELASTPCLFNNEYRLDLTLRCPRPVLEELQPTGPGGASSQALRAIRMAIECALPTGFQLGRFEARAGAAPAAVEGATCLKDLANSRPPSRRPKFLFQRTGQTWKVIYQGAPEMHLRDTLGARYLDYLLHHPGEVISAFDLEVTITPQKAQIRSKTGIQRAADPDTIRSCLREIQKLRAMRESALEEGRQAEVDSIEREIQSLEDALRDQSLASDTGERARGNVSKAIRALMRALRKGDQPQKALGAHLEACVSLGYHLRYSHPAGEVWL